MQAMVRLAVGRARALVATTYFALVATTLFALGTASATAASLGGLLLLQDEGSFYVDGTVKETLYATLPPATTPGQITINQMYVRYMVPYTPFGTAGRYPIVMVHGGTHTGKTFETTPDGREGWMTYFVRHGYTVYVVDTPGRGKSGFDRSVINQAKADNDFNELPTIGLSSNTVAWTSFRLGPSFGVPWPDNPRFPYAAADQYFAQLNPSAESTLVGGEAVQTPNALSALLDKIGPAIILSHSRGGQPSINTALMRPSLVKGEIPVEPVGCTLSNADISAVYVHVPTMFVWGDHTTPSAACVDTVSRINAAGGTAQMFSLPANGIIGNGHMMMLETNNLEIADRILDWIKANIH